MDVSNVSGNEFVLFFNNYNTILNIPSINIKYDISNLELQNKGYNNLVRIVKNAPQEMVNAIIKNVQNSMTNEKWLEINKGDEENFNIKNKKD